MGKGATLHKWEIGYHAPPPASQNVLRPCPVVRIIVTSIQHAPDAPSLTVGFLIANPGRIRPEFVDEIIEMLFGRQPNGEKHTWKAVIARLSTSIETENQAMSANSS